MSIENEEELKALERAGHVTRLVLEAMRERVEPGITTAELDEIGARVMAEHGGRSAPRHLYKYPGHNCISLNDEVVHGIPNQRAVRPGDLVKLDATVEVDGYIADAAITVAVPPTTRQQKQLVQAAEKAFLRALNVARTGYRVRDIGRAVEQSVRKDGFQVVRDLFGHGVGRAIHEEPTIPNFYNARFRVPLTRGLVFTIEPMLAAGSGEIVEDDDGWTIRTADASLSSHFEHTIVITDGKPRLITA